MKRNALFLMVLVMGLSLTACEKSPEQKLVAQKNQERLEAAAKEEPKVGSTLKDVAATASATYEYHYENEAGTVKIDANQAPVTIPLKDSIPMYHVYCGEFSQELVDKVYDYFFPDGEAYVTTGTDFTKDDCEKRILEFKQTIANIRDDEELTESEREEIIMHYEEIIANWEETLKTAPEESTIEFVKKDSTLENQQWEGVSGPFITKELDVMSKDQKKWLMLISSDADSPVASNINYTRDSEYSYSGESDVPAAKCTEAEKSQVGIKEEEARAIADDFFQKIGVDMEVHDTLLVKGYKEIDSEEPDGETVESESYTAYCFVYAQCVDGIEMAVTSSSYLPENDDVYDDPKANTYSSAGNFAVTVIQPLDVELTIPKIEKELVAGDTIPLNFQVMNLGRSQIFNVRCDVIGNGLTQTKTAFIGNMESGTAGEAAANIFIDRLEGEDSYGETTGTITLTYEDSLGSEHSQEYTFDTTIIKPVTSESLAQSEEETVSQWWVSILIVGGIGLLAAVGAGAYLLGRKQR